MNKVILSKWTSDMSSHSFYRYKLGPQHVGHDAMARTTVRLNMFGQEYWETIIFGHGRQAHSTRGSATYWADSELEQLGYILIEKSNLNSMQ